MNFYSNRLPSQTLPPLHNCRPENLKLKLQNPIYEASVLSTGLNATKDSYLYLHEKYVIDRYKSHHELIEELDKNLRNDRLIREIESGGDGEYEYDTLNWPKSVTCSQYGDIIVCDSCNHRILVFNKELVYKYSIGSLGNQPGQFNIPYDVEVSFDNRLLIADSNNLRLQIFEEAMIFRHSTTKVNRYFHNINSPKVTHVIPRSQTYQYKFAKIVQFKDKPVKIAKSRLSTLIGISCLNGLIYVLDAQFIIIAVARLEGDFIDMRNIALSRQSEVMMLKKVGSNLMLQFYQFKLDSLERLKLINPDKISQINNPIHLVNEIKIDREYLPGLVMDRGACLTTTPDTHNILVYDLSNQCLIEFDLNGNFVRILFRSCDYLEQLLSTSFSPEGHFITLEQEIRRLKQQNLSTDRPKTSNHSINKYIFKVKVRKYIDCDCHRHKPMIVKKRNPQNRSLSQLLHSKINKSSFF